MQGPHHVAVKSTLRVLVGGLGEKAAGAFGGTFVARLRRVSHNNRVLLQRFVELSECLKLFHHFKKKHNPPAEPHHRIPNTS